MPIRNVTINLGISRKERSMSDNQLEVTNMVNVTPIQVDDTVKNKLFVVVEGEEVQLNYEDFDLTFNSSESEIMDKIVPVIQEEKRVNIRDSYKIRKVTNNENIFIIPSSVAGI